MTHPERRQRWANVNTMLGAFWLLAALVFLFYLVPNHIDEAPMVENPMQSPRWLPTVAGWLIAALSLALILEGYFRPPARQGTTAARAPARRWILMLAGLAAYWLLFEPLGAILAGILGTLLMFVAHPVRKPWLYLLAIGLPWLVSVLFIHVLNVPLPSGTLWD
ncbi:tripartite tricarboxylate transporter TctB family protein [Stutzerimonas zhaodongensis]|uniref:Tripartite tricarboxylate transporter TctB family protein n=1 Tax=Stutzerimonas zhaodongensis TaxID=1176257 RepID=A0A3M2HZ85_9GAMM|nr:tripartite tricarboxylate transporter TctB family protein [Stutzerimonas zhaodongensis]MCQ4315690.1 tripartite tricarboxylate transporter TctB family protein [Stutzerimonas zhaodongensis]RMH91447.1 tripartite tricarboxylate transporter TctB family protein [Stutzerimonas zhaodongensis]